MIRLFRKWRWSPIFHLLIKLAFEYSTEISTIKSKVIVLSKVTAVKNSNRSKIIINDITVEQVTYFHYLEYDINSDNDNNTTVKAFMVIRIAKIIILGYQAKVNSIKSCARYISPNYGGHLLWRLFPSSIAHWWYK